MVPIDLCYKYLEDTDYNPPDNQLNSCISYHNTLGVVSVVVMVRVEKEEETVPVVSVMVVSVMVVSVRVEKEETVPVVMESVWVYDVYDVFDDHLLHHLHLYHGNDLDQSVVDPSGVLEQIL